MKTDILEEINQLQQEIQKLNFEIENINQFLKIKRILQGLLIIPFLLGCYLIDKKIIISLLLLIFVLVSGFLLGEKEAEKNKNRYNLECKIKELNEKINKLSYEIEKNNNIDNNK